MSPRESKVLERKLRDVSHECDILQKDNSKLRSQLISVSQERDDLKQQIIYYEELIDKLLTQKQEPNSIGKLDNEKKLSLLVKDNNQPPVPVINNQKLLSDHKKRRSNSESSGEMILTGVETRVKGPLSVPSEGHLKTFHCIQCGKGFKKAWELRRHQQTHTDQKDYRCSECPQAFRENNKLRKHLLQVHNISSMYECDECGETYVAFRAVRRHVKVEHAEMSARRDLPITMKTQRLEMTESGDHHSRQDDMEDDDDDDSTEDALDEMMDSRDESNSEVATPGMTLICELCNVFFDAEGDYTEHVATHHNTATEEKNTALNSTTENSTTENSTTENSATENSTAQNNTGQPMLKCTECDKSFSRTWELDRHCRTHTDHKDFWCMECGAGFRERRQLVIHQMKVHGVKTAYECDVCGASFDYYKLLHGHVRESHSWEGDDLHKCSFCPKIFTREADLKEHLGRHVGGWAYACDVCGQGFRTATTMEEHAEQHVQPVPPSQQPNIVVSDRVVSPLRTESATDVTCDECGKVCPSPSHLTLHQFTHKRATTVTRSSLTSHHCTHCPRGFPTPQALHAHTKALHAAPHAPHAAPHTTAALAT